VNSWNVAIYDHLNFDFLRDLALVASITRNPGVMEVNPAFPVNTVPEFIAYAKENPGRCAGRLRKTRKNEREVTFECALSEPSHYAVTRAAEGENRAAKMLVYAEENVAPGSSMKKQLKPC
jgi:hypothetical protein